MSLSQIQGTGESSPYDGQTVTVQGWVLATTNSGFFIQDSSDYGVYVYDRTFTRSVGDEVELVASISEYHGLTELSHLDMSQCRTLSAGNMQPTPVSVSSGDVGERHEGLLVSVAGTCSNHDIGHGEWMLDDGSGAVVIDDLLFSADEAPLYNMRYSVIGIGYYSYGSYKVEAIQISMDGQGNLDGPEAPPPPPPPPPPVSTADQCPDPPTAPFDHRSSPDILRIGTMNAEWLFDGVDDPSPSPWHIGSTDCAGLASGLNQCNEAGATAHLLRVAEVVERLDADILNLVEVEGCAILQRLADALPNAHYSPFLLRGTDTFLGQNVGLVSRLSPVAALTRSSESVDYPMEGSHCGVEANPGHTGVSKHYRTVFSISTWPEMPEIAWYGVHFKAIPTDPTSCAKREAQAQVIVNMVADDIAAGREIVICGDFNDFSASDLDQQHNMPTSRVLSMLQDIDGDGTMELSNLIGLVEESERYSDWWDHAPEDGADNGVGEHSELDHFLVSSGLRSRVSSVSIDHGHNPADVSDHWPIVVELRRNTDQSLDSCTSSAELQGLLQPITTICCSDPAACDGGELVICNSACAAAVAHVADSCAAWMAQHTSALSDMLNSATDVCAGSGH